MNPHIVGPLFATSLEPRTKRWFPLFAVTMYNPLRFSFFFFFFIIWNFIKRDKAQKAKPNKLYKLRPNKRPNIKRPQTNGPEQTKRTSGLQPIDENRWGRKRPDSTTCPIAQQSMAHASRHKTSPSSGARKLTRRSSANGEDETKENPFKTEPFST